MKDRFPDHQMLKGKVTESEDGSHRWSPGAKRFVASRVNRAPENERVGSEPPAEAEWVLLWLPDFEFTLGLYIQQEAQLMLTNPCDAFRDQSRSPNMTIPYVRYSFLLVWNSKFVFKTRRFSDILLRKCRDLEIWVRGHSKWYYSIDWVWFPISVL